MTDINDLKVGDLREILAMVSGTPAAKKNDPYKVGDKRLIRTVTHYWVGEIVQVTGDELVLDCASWVADTGRFGSATTASALKESEFCGDGCTIHRGAIVDSRPWGGDLPTETK